MNGLQNRTKAVLTELKKVYQGDEEIAEVFLAGILAKANILLVGGQGKGKTFLTETTATLLNERNSFSRVQGTAGLTENKFLASYNIAELLKGEEKVVFKNFVKAKIKFFDEISRTHPTVLNAIFSMLAEKVYCFGNERVKLDDFTFIATMNTEDTGTYELPPPLLDRFSIVLPISNPNFVGKVNILMNHMDNIQPILKEGELNEIWQQVEKITIPEKYIYFLSELTMDMQLCIHTLENNRGKEFLTNFPACCEECNFRNAICSRFIMPSERFALDTIKIAKGLAYLRGKSEVGKEELKTILPYALYYRIRFTPQYLKTQTTREEAVKAILSEISTYEKRRQDFKILMQEVINNPFDCEEKMERLNEMSQNDLLLKHLYNELKDKLKNKTTRYLMSANTPEKLEELRQKIISGELKMPNKEEVLKQIEAKLTPSLNYRAKINKKDMVALNAKMLSISPTLYNKMRVMDKYITLADDLTEIKWEELSKEWLILTITNRTTARAYAIKKALEDVGAVLDV